MIPNILPLKPLLCFRARIASVTPAGRKYGKDNRLTDFLKELPFIQCSPVFAGNCNKISGNIQTEVSISTRLFHEQNLLKPKNKCMRLTLQ